MPLAGWATSEGTRRYRDRFAGRAAEGHFRERGGLWLSSLGLGTYLGEPDDATDELSVRAATAALAGGVNVLDTAINYRFQRSERALGRALAMLVEQGALQRDEVVVASKAGFLTFDADYPADPRAYVRETFLDTGILRAEDVVAGMHSMGPRYLEDQLERSRRNLGLETIDIYYLHNPETQLQAVPRAEFLERLRAAFTTLEAAVAAGKIRCYGTATWDGYRRRPDAPDYLALEALVQVAEAVAGRDHHFRALQLPYNLGMPEAFAFFNQPLSGQTVVLLEAADRLGLSVFASASILQGQVARSLPDDLRAILGSHLESDAQRALQFVRSTPGIGSALVGMKQAAHVEENLRLAAQPLLASDKFSRLFSTE